MKHVYLSLTLLISSFILAQTAPNAAQRPAPAPAPQAPAAAKEVAPDAAIITIYDLCKEKLTNMGACKTVITRAEFDKFLQALGYSELPPQAKRQVANQYTRILTLATEADKEGIENRPETQELLRFARMQALAQAMEQTIRQRSQATPEQMQKFYDDNRARLVRVTLERVVVPVKQGATDNTEAKKLAEALRQRAVAGADFKVLQAEAYQSANMQNPPETRIVTMPDRVPAAHKAVLDLPAGSVSDLIQEPNRFIFYKLVSKAPIPFDEVKDAIQKTVTQNKAQDEMGLILNGAKPSLNPDYFGPVPESSPTAPAPSR